MRQQPRPIFGLKSITWLTASLALFVAASCGGSADSSPFDTSSATVATAPATDPPATQPPATPPPATAAPTTAPPATAAPSTDAAPATAPSTAGGGTEPPVTDSGAETPVEFTTMTFTREFLTIDVPDGWDIQPGGDSPTFVQTTDEAAGSWSFSFEGLQPLVEMSRGDLDVGLFREPAFHTAPSFEDWHQAVVDAASEFATVSEASIEQVDEDEAVDEAGRIVLDDGEVNGLFRTGRVGDQFILFGVTTPNALSDADVETINAITDSIVFDTDRIGDLDHAVDLVYTTSVAGPEINISILAPADWQPNLDSDSLRYDQPLTGARVEVTALPTQGGLDEMVIVAESLGLLDEGLVREDRVDPSGVEYAVLWEGDPDTATNAIIVSDDATNYASLTLIRTARDLIASGPPLVRVMVSSFVIS